VEREVERTDLLPEPLHFGRESFGGRVVVGTPERAHVGESQGACALVGKLDEALVFRPHRWRDRVPAAPGVEQLRGVAAFCHDPFEGCDVEAILAGRAVFTLPVHALERSGELGQLALQRRVTRRGQGEGQLEQPQLARDVHGELEAVELRGLDRIFDGGRDQVLVGLGRDLLGVVRDVGGLHPGRALLAVAELEQPCLGPGDEGLRVLHSGLVRGHRPGRGREDRRPPAQQREGRAHLTRR
jgi:hypothetical protein